MGEAQLEAVEEIESCETPLDDSYTAYWFGGLSAPVCEMRCFVHRDEEIGQN